MSRRSDPEDLDALREKIIGLGERSFRKSYYPKLRQQLIELQRFRTLLDQSNDAIFLLEVPSGRLIDVNESACRQLLSSRERLLSLSLGDVADQLRPSCIKALFRLGLPGAKESATLDTMLFKSNGERIPVEITIRLVSFGGFRYAVAAARDITERQQAEKALKESEERYRVITETALDAIITIDEESRIVHVNPAAETIFGYPLGELYGRPLTMLMPERLRQPHLDGMKRHIATGRTQLNWGSVQMPGLHRDGREFPLEISYGKFSKNENFFFTGIVRDISERKKAEEAIQQSRERLRNLIETTSDWVWEVDERCVYTYASPQVSRILGYGPEEVVGKTPFDLMPPEEAERVTGIFRKIAASQQPFSLLENVNLHKNGARVVLETSGVPFFDASGALRGYRGIDRDITERKKTEEGLQKAQKLESIGLLAGGIAHDFNNILTAILGNISLAKISLPPDDKAAQRLDAAEQASMRARGLCQQLLTFAKGGTPIKKTITLPIVIMEAVELAKRGSRIRVESTFPPDLRLVEADESQLGQAINNLAINGVQAMPEGGVLAVTTANLSLPPENHLGLPGGEYVRIDIRDQGRGILEEDQGKIFDPFFTTKERGSGLGLSISFSIIKRHGGTITVDSTPGEGTTFSIFLPASKKELVTPHEERHGEIAPGKGRILVMDDEEAVRDIAAEMLLYLGYRVETVEDGAAAITSYRQALAKGEPFAAVIVDVTIPAGMGGKETVRHLLKIEPQAKVIVSSGYANDPIMSAYADHGFKGVIPKPYRLDELSKVLRKVIGEKEALGV